MSTRHTWGLIGAATLGVISGYWLAPAPARRELNRRAARNWSTLETIAVREGRRAGRALASTASAAGRAAEQILKRITGPISVIQPPTEKLRDAIAADPVLARRAIWVDAVGDTLLLHGVVDSDEEWRSADLLARLTSPDGSVRNLLQVRQAQGGT